MIRMTHPKNRVPVYVLPTQVENMKQSGWEVSDKKETLNPPGGDYVDPGQDGDSDSTSPVDVPDPPDATETRVDPPDATETRVDPGVDEDVFLTDQSIESPGGLDVSPFDRPLSPFSDD